jgi:cytochrome c-type protein NapC
MAMLVTGASFWVRCVRMLTSDTALVGFVLLEIVLLVSVVWRDHGLKRRQARLVAFVAFFLMPVVAFWSGTAAQLERAKTTEFCLSCHVMEPYGQTLFLDDVEHLPAAHYQHRRVPKETACFACHTTYAMYGDLQAKIKGVQHLWVNYLGTIPAKIELYEPFKNRECLYCHVQERGFMEGEFHIEYIDDILGEETTCLECHPMTHPVDEVDDMPMWELGLEAGLPGADAGGGSGG